MTITKLGHCCMLIEENGTRILTDPGIYTLEQHTTLEAIDALLITHEHADHFHGESIKKLTQQNPALRIITNAAVGQQLEPLEIHYETIEHGQTQDIKGIPIHAFESPHAAIYPEISPVQNTGFLINSRLFYPGDALINPEQPIAVLALPSAGPWIKISEAIDYGLTIKPKQCFPVHDGYISSTGQQTANFLLKRFLEPQGIAYIVPELGVPFPC